MKIGFKNTKLPFIKIFVIVLLLFLYSNIKVKAASYTNSGRMTSNYLTTFQYRFDYSSTMYAGSQTHHITVSSPGLRSLINQPVFLNKSDIFFDPLKAVTKNE